MEPEERGCELFKTASRGAAFLRKPIPFGRLEPVRVFAAIP